MRPLCQISTWGINRVLVKYMKRKINNGPVKLETGQSVLISLCISHGIYLHVQFKVTMINDAVAINIHMKTNIMATKL